MAKPFNLLLPLDGSSLADLALLYVERLCLRARARGEEVRVHLLAVVSPAEPGSASWPEAHLEGVQARLGALGIPAERHVRRSPAAGDAILALARELPADLLVMSSHGRSGVLRLVRGSVAEHVLRRSEGPLLLLTPRVHAPGSVQRILVPLDGTERSAAVLPLVERVAKTEDAGVLLLRVTWDATTRPLLAVHCSPARMVETLAPWKAQLERAGLVVEARAAEGDAAREILRHAEGPDVGMIAMATHGHTGFERFVDGSVTEAVLRRTHHPLLVVRASQAADGATATSRTEAE